MRGLSRNRDIISAHHNLKYMTFKNLIFLLLSVRDMRFLYGHSNARNQVQLLQTYLNVKSLGLSMIHSYLLYNVDSLVGFLSPVADRHSWSQLSTFWVYFVSG